MTGHLLALPNAGGSSASTNTTGTTVHHGAVGHGRAGEVVTTHNALEALTLARADDVNPSAFLKEAATGVSGTFSGQLRGIYAELLEELSGSDAEFLEVTSNGLGETLLLLLVESNLDSVVTIALHGLNLAVSVAGDVNDSHGDHGAGLLIENAGHANFLTNES